MTNEKAIRIQERPVLPRYIIESDLSLQSYLAENVKANREHEMFRLRTMKATETRKRRSLEAAARKIKVEPI